MAFACIVSTRKQSTEIHALMLWLDPFAAKLALTCRPFGQRSGGNPCGLLLHPSLPLPLHGGHWGRVPHCWTEPVQLKDCRLLARLVGSLRLKGVSCGGASQLWGVQHMGMLLKVEAF